MKKEQGLNNVSLSYSELSKAKDRIEKKFGSQVDLIYKNNLNWEEIIREVLFKGRECDLVEVEDEGVIFKVPRGQRALNLGSGSDPENVWFEKALDVYHTLEPDEKIESTFKNFDQVPAGMKYNMIIAREVVEHINREEIFDFLKSACHLIEAEGCLVLTFPNICNPGLYFDHIDHVTSSSYGWIAAMLEIIGMKVELVYLIAGGSDAFKDFSRIIENSEGLRTIAMFLKQFYSLHPAKSVVIVAKNENLPR